MPGDAELLDRKAFRETRNELGGAFVRILGYFREDGQKAVADIEQAMREDNAAALVRPAHKLKGEARQFGAEQLGQLAEDIEFFARGCVEAHESPAAYITQCAGLRPLFADTIAALDAETNAAPPPATPAGSPRRATPFAAPHRPTGFGRRS